LSLKKLFHLLYPLTRLPQLRGSLRSKGTPQGTRRGELKMADAKPLSTIYGERKIDRTRAESIQVCGKSLSTSTPASHGRQEQRDRKPSGKVLRLRINSRKAPAQCEPLKRMAQSGHSFPQSCNCAASEELYVPATAPISAQHPE